MRKAEVKRETLETKVEVSINLDGSGLADIKTGVGFLNHLLGATAKHGLIDLRVSAESRGEPDSHHLVEDTAIVLGQALNAALGEKKGIRRFGSALIPMDEAVSEVALDLSGRGYMIFHSEFPMVTKGEVEPQMIIHFMQSLSSNGRFTLHMMRLQGQDYHHVTEALFKALGVALRKAFEYDLRRGGQVPSQKGVVE